ncbi:MAG: YIP1 family protein [Sphingomonadales bacterium]|nr:YIP1 family protein [Sphingomonadales bacterium]
MNQETAGSPRGTFQRAKAILLRPREEWPVIAREPMSSGDLFTSYALPLAAIAPAAGFLGSQIFGYSAGAITYRPSIPGSLGFAVAGYLQALIALFLLSFIVNKLAPSFGGESSSRNAFKLVVYSATAGWVAGIFALFPSLTILLLLGLYGVHLFYTGAGPIMKVPAEKLLTFTIVVIVAAIVVNLCLGAVISSVGRLIGGPGWGAVSGGRISNSEGESFSFPDLNLDPGKINDAAKQAEAAVAGKGDPVAPDALQALLPESIGAYRRTAIESNRAGPVSNAEGSYEAEGKHFTLKVADMGVIGAAAGMAGTLGIESNKQDGDGYSRTTTKDGNLVVEKWNRNDARGSFMTMSAKRFMIEAEGEAASIDELKAAVATIDQSKLADLAKD